MIGGKRQGAGRPPAHIKLKKRAISIKLPEWLIQWMDNQPGTNRAILIESALKTVHNINAPKNKHLDI